MIKEHEWKPDYTDSASGTVEQCANCPVQRRSGGSDKWQYRASSADLGWVASSGRTAPDCSDAGNTWFGSGYRSPITDEDRLGTEQLEAELKELSARIAADPLRFQQVREELARRHAAGNDQPAPDTEEQRVEKQREAELDLNKNLVLKITAMESEQAKLVVEAEIFKSQRDEAVARLALLARTSTVVPKAALDELRATIDVDVTQILACGDVPPWIARLHRAACAVVVKSVTAEREPARAADGLLRREPLSREAARELALRHIKGNPFGTPSYNIDWVIDTIVEASK